MSTPDNTTSTLRTLVQRQMNQIEVLQKRVADLSRPKDDAVAIVGIGCRFPGGANDAASFWRVLRDGVDTTSDMPDRCRRSPLPESLYARRGAFLSDVDAFDASFFHISAREASMLDPQQRILLEVAWHALEDAGYVVDRSRADSVGTFIGIMSADYGEYLGRGAALESIDPYFGTGRGYCFASGRLSFAFGFSGPSLSVDTACSSSLVALHLAVRSLRLGECRMALAGGVNVILSDEITMALCQTGALARDGRCKTFDAAADGYARGEGCGVVVLKRLADAQADGDRIYAVVRGSAVNHDGASSGLTVPNGPAQTAVIRAALRDAAIAPDRVDYIEAHGTGTKLGDPIELGAIAEALGERTRPAWVGSVKTNIGHAEAAAGISGVIKAALMLHHRELVPSLHLREPNPRISLDPSRLRIATEVAPLASFAPLAPLASAASVASAAKRSPVAGVSSFGLSGTNAHVLLEAAGERVAASEPARKVAPLVFALSAKTPQSLSRLAVAYAEASRSWSPPAAEAAAHTSRHGRASFTHRLAVVARHAHELPELFARAAAGSGGTHVAGEGLAAAETLARAYERGEAVDWSSLDGNRPRSVFTLPGYAFERRRHWFQPKIEVLKERPMTHTITDEATPEVSDIYTQFDTSLSQLGRNGRAKYLHWAPLREPLEGFSWLHVFCPAAFPGAVTEAHRAAYEGGIKQIRDVAVRGIRLEGVRRVVDIGCGYGTDLLDIAAGNPNMQGHGYNITLAQVDVAQQEARRRGLGSRVSFFHRDSSADPFPDRYDLALAFQVIHHVRDKKSLLANVAGHLSNGGVMAITDMVSTVRGQIDHASSMAHLLPESTWTDMLADAGLRVLSCVDASREIGVFFDDPQYEENLAILRSSMSAQEVAFIEGPHMLGRLLREGLARYLVVTAQRDELLSTEALRGINRALTANALAFGDVVDREGVRPVFVGRAAAVSNGAPHQASPHIDPAGIEKRVLQAFRSALKMDADERLDLDSKPLDLGVDSFLALAIQRDIEAELGLPIDVSELLGDGSLRAILRNLAAGAMDAAVAGSPRSSRSGEINGDLDARLEEELRHHDLIAQLESENG